ncbi:NAD-dependent deacylase [Rhodohalobacter sp. SW132]|uniref:Sir2 family NAD-dependent protein deacetylase n=1 Tax=Rhodohalobacter sp. SW132 TaxID=2293433 RepID=UPI000E2892DE|nr:Sir2 family NAD-dependent protein deacetylase [Rhodohalobacter sp. SW132]REL33523.1 NAD-dependent deacylase [Rhodohalobacter sp. SW132]
MKSIAVLTGAGMSADSGLSTFRDSGGLWEGFDIEDVATVEGWQRDPDTVLEFYNQRRAQAAKAKPNKGHTSLAELEEYFNVSIITQNVDDLHEKAGSANVLHLHGMLRQARSSVDPDAVIDIGSKRIETGDTADDGSQLRPNVVWFGEAVPNIEPATEIIQATDILVVIGTSLVVYPAAGLVDFAPAGIPKFVVDPTTPDLVRSTEWTHYSETAGVGVPKLKSFLIEKYT